MTETLLKSLVEQVVHEQMVEGGLAGPAVVRCQICGKHLGQITRNHLVGHQTTMAEYRTKFPNAPMQADTVKQTGATNPFYGKTHSEETKRLLAEKRKGQLLSVETKRKISDALKQSSFQQTKMKEEAYRNKLRFSLKEYWNALNEEERKERMSKTHKAQLTNKRWTPLEEKDDKEAFEFQVRKLTEINYRKHFNDIDNAKLRGKGYDLDHRLSIHEGFTLGLKPETVAHYQNLACIPEHENKAKNSKSSLTVQMLFELVGRETNDQKLLLCGGLAGHMSHLYENRDLTFGDLKQVFLLASQGKLEEVSEKLDGQNFFFTYNLAQKQLKFARNKGNIKTGGMSGSDVATKWADKPAVGKAFGMAYKIMTNALATLDARTLKAIFGPTGNIWYSAEVVSTDNPNVINYDRNVIVFHKSGTSYDAAGSPVETVDTAQNFNTLVAQVGKLQSAIAESGWKVLGPVMVPLQKLSNNEPYKIAVSRLGAIMSRYGMSDANTLNDMVVEALKAGPLANLGVPPKALDFLARLMTDETRGIAERKKELAGVIKNKDAFIKLAPVINQAPKMIAAVISPVEDLVSDFAVGMLSGVHSILALHPDEEVRRLRGEVQAAISKIKSSGKQEFLDILDKQLSRLRTVDNITSSMEGIVFKFKGHYFKLTGAFAPVNQLLGLVRYGRGNTQI